MTNRPINLRSERESLKPALIYFTLILEATQYKLVFGRVSKNHCYSQGSDFSVRIQK